MKKTAIALVFLCVLTSARAIEPLILNIEGVIRVGQRLNIYCNANLPTLPQCEDFTVTLGNTELPVVEVTEIKDDGISLVFLVDVSGSMSNAQFTAVKTTLAELSEDLSDTDNICLITVGNEAYANSFVSGTESIQAEIESLARSAEDTNLYESIVKSLAILSTSESSHTKKALIVFSDGEEDYLRGITFEETAMKIENGHIPIYTVAMLGWNPNPRHTESAKILGSFARLSPGGLHFIHTLDADASKQIANDILTSIHSGFIVGADLSDFSSDGSEMLMWLELNSSGIGVAGGGYNIPTAGFSGSATTTSSENISPSPKVSDPQNDSPADTPSLSSDDPPDSAQEFSPDESQNGGISPEHKVLGALIIGSAVLLAVLCVYIYLRNRNDVHNEQQSMSASRSPPPGQPRIALCLTKIGPVEEQVFHAEFSGTLIIGRDQSTTNLSFRSDSQISPRHCAIGYEPDGIVLRDLGSSTGTIVNGVPIESKYLLMKNDIISIGSLELKVTWDAL